MLVGLVRQPRPDDGQVIDQGGDLFGIEPECSRLVECVGGGPGHVECPAAVATPRAIEAVPRSAASAAG